jgi:hypothetical protein
MSWKKLLSGRKTAKKPVLPPIREEEHIFIKQHFVKTKESTKILDHLAAKARKEHKDKQVYFISSECYMHTHVKCQVFIKLGDNTHLADCTDICSKTTEIMCQAYDLTKTPPTPVLTK